MGVIVIAHNL